MLLAFQYTDRPLDRHCFYDFIFAEQFTFQDKIETRAAQIAAAI